MTTQEIFTGPKVWPSGQFHHTTNIGIKGPYNDLAFSASPTHGIQHGGISFLWPILEGEQRAFYVMCCLNAKDFKQNFAANYFDHPLYALSCMGDPLYWREGNG